MKTKIAIVEDEVLFRKSISYVIQNEEVYELVFEGNNGLEIIDYLETVTDIPDVILMDINMPKLRGDEASKIILAKYPNIRIVVLTTYNSHTFVENILKIGASAYISKNATPEEMLITLKNVVEKGIYFKDLMKQYIFNEKITLNNYDFSQREIDILRLICEQYSAKEISEKLFLSPRTVDGYRNGLLEKTNSKNITGLVMFAIKNNILR